MRSLGQLIAETIEFLLKNLRFLFPIAFFGYVASAAVKALVTAVGLMPITAQTSPETLVALLPGYLIGGGIVILTTALIQGLVLSTMFWAANERLNLRPFELGTAYKAGLRLLWPLSIIYLLMLLAVLGGLFLLIIPGFVFAVWFALAPYALVVEGKRGTEALQRSRELIRGNGWAFFGYALVIAILGGVFSGVTNAIFAIPKALLDSWLLENTSAPIMALSDLVFGTIIAVPQALVLGATTLAYLIIYYDLKKARETVPAD